MRIILLLLALVFVLSACGVRGDPEAPPGGDKHLAPPIKPIEIK
jgi:hypothetical protein